MKVEKDKLGDICVDYGEKQHENRKIILWNTERIQK